jgi:hypothetical protein
MKRYALKKGTQMQRIKTCSLFMIDQSMSSFGRSLSYNQLPSNVAPNGFHMLMVSLDPD